MLRLPCLLPPSLEMVLKPIPYDTLAHLFFVPFDAEYEKAERLDLEGAPASLRSCFRTLAAIDEDIDLQYWQYSAAAQDFHVQR